MSSATTKLMHLRAYLNVVMNNLFRISAEKDALRRDRPPSESIPDEEDTEPLMRLYAKKNTRV